MKLRDYSQQAEDLRRIIPLALKRTTRKINEILPLLSEGKKNTLHEWFPLTVDKTKFIAPIFNGDLELSAEEIGVDYISEEAVGYDCISKGVKLENKLSLAKEKAAGLATGNNHSKTKVPQVFCTKLQYDVDTNKIIGIFAAIVDLSKATNPLTRWKDDQQKGDDGEVKNNNGFSTLFVHRDDGHCVTPIMGGLKPLTKRNVYYHASYESCIY